MKPEDVRAYRDREWSAVRRAKERYWTSELERMSLTEAFQVADGLREAALLLAGDRVLTDRDQDLRDLIALKRKLMDAYAGHRH